MKCLICDNEWFDELIMQRSKLLKYVECECKRKHWILSKMDYEVILCSLGQDKVMKGKTNVYGL